MSIGGIAPHLCVYCGTLITASRSDYCRAAECQRVLRNTRDAKKRELLEKAGLCKHCGGPKRTKEDNKYCTACGLKLAKKRRVFKKWRQQQSQKAKEYLETINRQLERERIQRERLALGLPLSMATTPKVPESMVPTEQV